MSQHPWVQSVEAHIEDLTCAASAIRSLSMDTVLKSKSGHIGLPLGCADILALLYFKVLRYDIRNPRWFNRDRFILSAGHGSAGLYAALHVAGISVTLNDLQAFRQLGSPTPGHPEYNHTPGVECTTGPLGQGLATAVGLAIAERMWAQRLNQVVESGPTPAHQAHMMAPWVDHATYVLAGDGCLMEGVTSEACSLAGTLKCNKLVVIYDQNNITIDGKTDISFTESVADRYRAYGWNVFPADGHNFTSLAEALVSAGQNAQMPLGTTGPSLIIAKTVPGKGSPKWEGQHKIHGNPMTAQDVIDAKLALGSDAEPFVIPQAWQQAIERLRQHHAASAEQQAPTAALPWLLLPYSPGTSNAHSWQEKSQHTVAQMHPDSELKKLWQAAWQSQSTASDALFSEWLCDDAQALQALQNLNGPQATRVSSGKTLQILAQVDPRLVGGSADLAGSNNTTLEKSRFIHAKDFGGRNLHFGVREHAMGAILNGLALHGFKPYGGTFSVFSDYLRPAIRMAALMGLSTVFVLTHDSIGVGEDGPTHQPIEHTASLRLIPGLHTFRPADAYETAACWVGACLSQRPTALILSRQDLPDLTETRKKSWEQIPHDFYVTAHGGPTQSVMTFAQGLIKYGATLVRPSSLWPERPLRCSVVASGSEVALAVKVAETLEHMRVSDSMGRVRNLAVQVVSAPAPQVLAQSALALNQLMPEEPNTLLVSLEAGVTLGWGDLVGRRGLALGIQSFGASAPAPQLFEHFGLTVSSVVSRILNHFTLKGL